MELAEPFDHRLLTRTRSSRLAFAHQWPEAARPGGPPVHGGQSRSDRERLLIETVAVRPLAGVGRPAAPWRDVYHSPRRRRLLGGLAFCFLSLGASALVARHLSGASWPLEGAHAPLVFLAGCSYLASFGFRAFGWHQLFPSRERPDGARCLAACGAAAASGVVLPFRLDYLVKIATLRRMPGVKVGLEAVAVSIILLGLVDAVAFLPLSISATATSSSGFRVPLILVVLFGVGAGGVLVAGRRLARLRFVSRRARLRAFAEQAGSLRPGALRDTIVAWLFLLGCWTTRAAGSMLLLAALGVGFSPTLALCVLCLAAAVSLIPIASGGAIANVGATAAVLIALGVERQPAINFGLASGLLLCTTAAAAA